MAASTSFMHLTSGVEGMLDAEEVCESFDDIVEVLLVSDCEDSEWVSSSLVSAILDMQPSKSVSLCVSTVSKAVLVSKMGRHLRSNIY
jgi:hypothetical protein